MVCPAASAALSIPRFLNPAPCNTAAPPNRFASGLVQIQGFLTDFKPLREKLTGQQSYLAYLFLAIQSLGVGWWNQVCCVVAGPEKFFALASRQEGGFQDQDIMTLGVISSYRRWSGKIYPSGSIHQELGKCEAKAALELNCGYKMPSVGPD